MRAQDDALGRLAFERRLLTREQLDAALATQAEHSGMSLGDVLQGMDLLTEAQVRQLCDEISSAQAATLKDVAPNLVGRPFARFTILERLGKGGMGVVYKAWDPQHSRHVAIKCMLATDDPTEVQRFLREASTATQLTHPNIVAVYEIDEFEGTPYIVMELVSGQSFGRLLHPRTSDPKGIPLRDALAIVRDIARALNYAHERGIVHRDVKPENVMVDEQRRAKLMDFGLAREVARGATLTTTGHVMGTPYYMSPEQAMGSREAIDHRADIWALGVMLYEIGTRRLPFGGEAPAEVLHRIVHEDLVAPRRMDPNVPRAFETVILKCLEHEPNRRYATAGGLADDLDRYLSGRPVTARRASVVYRLRRKLARRKSLVAVIAISVLVLAVAAVVVLPGLGRAQRRASEAQEAALGQLRRTTKAALSAALGFRQMGRLADMDQYLKQVEEACRQASQDLPTLAEPHYRMGRMYRARMMDAEGLAEQNRALSKEGAYAPALYERVVLNARVFRARVQELLDEAWSREGARLAQESRGQIVAGLTIRSPSRDALVAGDVAAKEVLRTLEADLRQLERSHDGLGDGELACARGLLAWVAGQHDAARRALEEAVDKAPELEEAYEALASIADQAGQYDEAIRWRSAGIDRDRGYLPHLDGRAMTHLMAGLSLESRGEDAAARFKAGVDDLTEALRREPGRVASLRLRGFVRVTWGGHRQRRGEDPAEVYSAAIEDLDQALARQPASAATRTWRGDARLNWATHLLGASGATEPLFKAAIADFSEAMKLAPNREDAWVRRGLAHVNWALERLARGQETKEPLRNAIDDLSHALGLNPSREEGWMHRGVARMNLGGVLDLAGEDAEKVYRDAIADFDEALRRAPTNDEILLRRGEARGNRGLLAMRGGEDASVWFQEALADFDRAQAINARRDETWVSRATAKMNWGSWRGGPEGDRLLAAAIEDVGRALELNPRRRDAWVIRADARSNLGVRMDKRGEDPAPKYEAAIRDLDRAVEVSPTHPEARAKRGVTRMNLANAVRNRGGDSTALYQSALKDIDDALAINQSDAQIRAWRGDVCANWARLRVLRREEADEFYRSAVADYDEAIRRNHANAQTLKNRASLRNHLANEKAARGDDPTADYEAAVADDTRAVELNPRDVEALDARGVTRSNWAAYATSRDRAEQLCRAAVEDGTETIRLAPGIAAHWDHRATSRRNWGALRYEKWEGDPFPLFEPALEDYAQAVKLDPKAVESWESSGSLRMNMGIILMNRGQDARDVLTAAGADLDRAIALAPNNAQLWLYRGTVYYNRGRLRTAYRENASGDFRAVLSDYGEAIRLNSALKAELEQIMEDCRRHLKE